jgi:protein-disulfide isomerase
MKAKPYERSALVLFVVLVLGAVCDFSQTVTTAKETSPVSQSSQEATEKIIHDYILKHPEVIREALIALDTKEKKEKLERTRQSVKLKQDEIFHVSDDPVGGNPNGDVSIAVFFDYSCGYCRKALPGLSSLLAKDRLLRVVYKEFPILGPQSETAALAALAAARQGKYIEFHDALFATQAIDDEEIKAISSKLGLDYGKLLKDMRDPKLTAYLTRNFDLANALDIDGTPAFIIGDTLIPGAIDAASLAEIVKAQRARKANVDPKVLNVPKP